MNRITPEELTRQDIGKNDVFVPGTNESGIHGSGAARFAWKELGIEWGVGFGPSGDCFGIPTKDWDVKTLPLNVIAVYVKRFIAFTKLHSTLRFYVTKIGCGLAGLTPAQIAPMFEDAIGLENVYLPQEFWNVLIPDLSEYFDLTQGVPIENQFNNLEDYLLEIVRKQTPHGYQGVDEITKRIKVYDVIYDVTLSNIQWNRYDKQYYFIDNYNPVEITFKKLD